MPDTSVKHLHLIAHRTNDSAGDLEYIGAVIDITRRQQSEQALETVRTELTKITRIMSLSALTASIAHEINQPISGIITNASTCLRMLAADPPNIDGARETARRTIRDGNRAADVTARLRALFSNRTISKVPLDLNDAIIEVIALFSGELHRGKAVLTTELCSNLAPVMGDRVQLQQVIMNLLRNAVEAMGAVDDRPRHLLIRTEPGDAGHVLLLVSDAGIGLDNHDIERLFEPFRSTKHSGMGIGLSISRTIVEAHNGRLWATGNPDHGATFSFSLPCVSKNGTSISTDRAIKGRATPLINQSEKPR
jgi:signal transduction histidine kinase